MGFPAALLRRRRGASPLAIYAVLGRLPQLAFDFDGEKYFTGGFRSTFDDSITHSASSNATMVDSDGLLKWRPHNLVRYSEDFSNAVWTDGSISGGSRVNGDLSVSISEGYAYIQQLVSTSFGVPHIITVDVTCDTAVTAVPLRAGMGTSNASNLIDFAAGETKRVSFSVTPSSGTLTIGLDARDAVVPGGSNETGYVITLGRASAYRSDLGGMVNNPDRGDSYVPTTSTARYLSRRGHHVYNGTSWVNEGLLVESEARTNLALHSKIGSGGVLESGWVVQGATASATTSTAPDGSTDGVTVSITLNAGNNLNREISGLTIGQTYTASMWLKGTAGQQIYFTAEDTAAAQELITFNGEWQRVSKTYTATSTTQYFACEIFDRSAGAHLPNVTFEVWGGQYEPGSTPSSYIPTSGATVTRAAETLTVPAAKLPWPTPNVIGPELVTNGTFDTDTTGWTVFGGSLQSVSGQLVLTEDGVAAYSNAYQTITTEAGKVYAITVSLISRNGPSKAQLWVGIGEANASMLNVNPISTGVDQTFYFVASGSSAVVQLVQNNSASAGDNTVWDDVSVREIDPLAVSIQMQGRMTYADTNPANGIEALQVNWELDANNRIQIYNNTGSTRVGDQFFLQRNATVQDFVGGSGNYSPGINVPFNIASRHGSTFINGAVDGTALTADTTPTALPDLSATDLNLGFDYMGTIKLFRIWADDLGDSGIAEASS